MIILTKEVFIQLKSVMSVTIVPLMQHMIGGPHVPPLWQVHIMGVPMDSNAQANANMNMCMGDMPQQITITCESREDAQKAFKEIMKRVVDSGSIQELNDKLLDDVLKEN